MKNKVIKTLFSIQDFFLKNDLIPIPLKETLFIAFKNNSIFLHFLVNVLGKCALAQVRCFNKWKDSNCIISKLVNNVSTTRKWTWDKESKILNDKLNNISSSSKEIMEFYWDRGHEQ
ncbi:hypothetical protein BCR32DRAFT_283439 [Anaeromyces robustus]|uniref:Uncharacterized protein n=1 Tax=Anaeromyces robustus TaxID=1754192 RepID=A0A1Y1WVF6_9FUNG|nr:hypothetical protein BCR32DRAFT_283439 [Anaeromyces robustus]|eukprot:ORX77186.1 hypothetical protein BCR32DRAFT_283439 [Anaeromyces robustus]